MKPLVKYPDPLLTTPTQAFDFANPQVDPHELSKELIETMHHYNGVGLAANQIGYNLSVFAMRGLDFNYVCFNPRIVSFSGESTTMEEGCLSFPGLIIKIKRPEEIRCRFFTPSGGIDTKTFGGLSARTFQHELDHLQGKLFYTRAGKYHRDLAMKRWKLANDRK